jgi:uncharacterized protein YciI
MKKLPFLAALLMSFFAVASLRAAEPAAAPAAAPAVPAAPAKQTYVYVLRLAERLHDDKAWTPTDEKAVGAHFLRLKEDTAARKVVFAGRTMEPGDKTMGLVVFEAANDAEAKAYAESDPAVSGGVMTVTVHPFALVLQRKP